MINWIKKIFQKNNTNSSYDNDDQCLNGDSKFIWCLIGNVIDERLTGINKELKRGTKHFVPNTKVYCFPAQWGDGYEDIIVIGRQRKSSKSICIIMPAKYITNWRLKKVYHPYILHIMQAKHGWTDSNEDKEQILKMVTYLTATTIE